MPEIFRTRDCVILFKGDTYSVSVTPEMALKGWAGGQGVMWVDPSPRDDFLVTYSDGHYCGFMLWGSEESSDLYTAMTGNQPAYKFAVIGGGGWLIMTRSFEQYTWTSRQGPGPLVPLAYHESDRLLFSTRGLFTKEDEWSLVGDPRAPNTYYCAYVVQAPSPRNNHYLTIQVSI